MRPAQLAAALIGLAIVIIGVGVSIRSRVGCGRSSKVEPAAKPARSAAHAVAKATGSAKAAAYSKP